MLLGSTTLALTIAIAGQPIRHASAQENVPFADGPFTQRLSGVGRLEDFGSYLRLEHYAGDGVGYTDSYTSLGLFQPLNQGDSFWFSDSEFLLANDARVGANIGLGYRFYSPQWNRVFGASLWYDLDGRHVGYFQQLGVSLESLGEIWDFRTNVYIPTGRAHEWLDGTGDLSWTTSFQEDHVLLLGSRRVESAMTGLDMELGARLPGWLGQHGVRGYGGWYHFQAEGVPQAWGAMGRLEGQLTQDTSVQLMFSNDRVFDTSLVFGIAWHFPGGSARHGGAAANAYERLFQPVQRRANVVVARAERNVSTLVAEDAESGDPIEVLHVDSGASSGGDGTFESPFRTLAEAQAGSEPGQIIFVHGGSYAGGITLQPGQRLLGDGIEHWIATRQGILALPILHPGESPELFDGIRPTFEAGRYAVAVAAADTEVSGFLIHPSAFLPAGSFQAIAGTTASTSMVGGTASGSVVGILAHGFTGDVDINRNAVQDGDDSGILVSNVTGDVNIQGNTVNNIAGHHGIHVQAIAGDVAVTGNTVENVAGGDGILIGSYSNLPDGTARISGNVTAAENVVHDISFSGIGGRGLHITDISGSAEMSHNTISQTEFAIDASWIGYENQQSMVVIEGNMVANTAYHGIMLEKTTAAYVRNNSCLNTGLLNSACPAISITSARRIYITGNEVLHGAIGVAVNDVRHATIEDNHIADCENGIIAFRYNFPVPRFVGGTLTIRNNRIESITNMGMSIAGVDALTTVDSNTVTTIDATACGVYFGSQRDDLTFSNNRISGLNLYAAVLSQSPSNQDLIFTIQGNIVEGGQAFVIENHRASTGRVGVNLIGNTTDGVFRFERGGTGSEGAALEYYLQDNIGPVENPGGRATQVFAPITR